MLELTIITAMCVAGIAFMLVFFLALCQDTQAMRRCPVIRIDPEQSTTDDPAGASIHATAERVAAPRWAIDRRGEFGLPPKVVEISPPAAVSPLLRNRGRK